MTLENLKSEELQLLEQLKLNRSNQKLLNTELFLRKFAINFGDIIEFVDCNKKLRGIFDSIEYNYYHTEPLHIRVKLFNNDGTLGKRITRCSNLGSIKATKIIEI